jgi:Fe-S oxidoreductase
MMIKQAITTNVLRELDGCIECNKCLDACPVYSKSFQVKELNNTIRNATSISPEIIDFTFSCMQCRQCVPVCPNDLHRDEMLLLMKHYLQHKKPRSYDRYVLIRGPQLSLFRALAQTFFVIYQKLRNKEIAQFMETKHNAPNSLLFFPGCYIYSPKTINQTLRLLKHIDKPFSILAGLSHCCGMPYYLQGEFQQTEKCLTAIKKQLQQINPKIIISSCNECLEAIQLVNRYYHTSYQIKTVVDFLAENIDKFPKIKVKDTVSFHEACRYNRSKSRGLQARKAIKQFGNLKEMKHVKSNAGCCAHWNYEAYGKNDLLRKERLIEANNTASVMACECLTCYEQFLKMDSDVEVVDILDLFEQSLDADTKT